MQSGGATHRFVMRFTSYFVDNVLPRRAYLRTEWIEDVLAEPEWVEPQSDGRIRYWRYIPELGRALRVVTLEDGITVHNAFPDRRFRRPAR